MSCKHGQEVTHYAGCDCHEEGWVKRLNMERDEIVVLRNQLAEALDTIERYQKALTEISDMEGFCIFGTADLEDTAENDFRQGSAYGYSALAAVAREALNPKEGV